ncbi:uncharacterized protein KY384_000848 [Bacidia gigantensis]|uniref:uncharacterized protein n=1 Tax=Bacidia gigantensis TaxID=2732470 RepID=UPI001D042447|nr:uncharacterized protein KY384_000848 [Bacidia gigantensis]KAG8534006.1 hypothetical protein KY384_000848 [Bacidia gigantensis]
MASRRSRPPSRPPSPSPSPPAPRRAPSRGRDDEHSPPPVRKRRHNNRSRGAPGYSQPHEKNPPNKIELLLSVFRDTTAQSWHTVPYSYDRRRATDTELWSDIRSIYRNELQLVWRRLLLFKRLKFVAPITYTRNEVPVRVEEKDLPNKHAFMHAYHHPEQLRTEHSWVDFFAYMAEDNEGVSVGLEFVEGLWAEKLAVVAVAVSVAIVVVSIVWCVRGGELQTVFTVMGFVLSGAAGEWRPFLVEFVIVGDKGRGAKSADDHTAEVALVALYYQVTLPG